MFKIIPTPVASVPPLQRHPNHSVPQVQTEPDRIMKLPGRKFGLMAWLEERHGVGMVDSTGMTLNVDKCKATDH
jgi:hypothetical protein